MRTVLKFQKPSLFFKMKFVKKKKTLKWQLPWKWWSFSRLLMIMMLKSFNFGDHLSGILMILKTLMPRFSLIGEELMMRGKSKWEIWSSLILGSCPQSHLYIDRMLTFYLKFKNSAFQIKKSLNFNIKKVKPFLSS